MTLTDKLVAKHGGKLPDDSTPASVAGTKAHDYAERLIRYRMESPDADWRSDFESDREELGDVAENAEIYAEYVVKRLSSYRPDEIQWKLEDRFPLWYEPGSHGTVDFWLFEKMTGVLTICDYKSGFVTVSARNNLQLSVYSIAALDKLSKYYEITEIEVEILQPQHKHVPDVWCFDLEELDHQRTIVNRAVREIDDPLVAPRLVPGDAQCKWCKHARSATCPALAEGLFADIPTPDDDVEELPVHKLFGIVERSKLYKGFLDAVDERVKALPASELEAYGMKLIRGNRRFFWEDEEAAASVMENAGLDPFEHKMKTPAKARKEMDDDAPLEDLYGTKFNKPMLVSADDRRPSITTEEV
jgi:hypothetical protein